MSRQTFCKTMESRVSNREANFDEFKKSQAEFRISQAKFRAEIKATGAEIKTNQDLILLQLKLLAEKLGVESSTATPMHQLLIKMASPISLVKSNQIVLKLQSFHKEKGRAREKVKEFWSQFRPKYKPKCPPFLRPTLKKFKRVRDYAKYHEDDSARFHSSSKFQGSFGFFRSALARKNEKVFDLLDKQVDDSVKSPPFLDSVCKIGIAKDLLYGLPISELLEKKDESPSSRPIRENKVGFQLIVSVGTISKLQSLKNLDNGNKSHPCSVFDKFGTHDMIPEILKDEILEFGCKKIWVTEIGEEIYPFRSKPATILEFDCKDGNSQVFNLKIHVSTVEFKEANLPGLRALYLFDKMSNSGYILDIKLGYHMSIRDKGGTNFLASFESIDLLASYKASGFCVVFNRSMGYYCKGIRDKGGGLPEDKIWKAHLRLFREIARLLANDYKKRVMIVDTSNEIGGDGDIPHGGIGSARRMQVPFSDMQHTALIKAVENHMPRVLVIDEIGTKLEALAASRVAQRGIQLVATADGVTIENLIMHPSLEMLVGGIQSMTLGDKEASRRGVQKTVQERQGPATFSCAVEIISKDELRVHRSLETTVEAILYEFNSMDFLAICELGCVLNAKQRSFLEEADPLIVPIETTFLAFNLFDKMWFSSCCIVLSHAMHYWKGIRDKGGGSKLSVSVADELIIQVGDSNFYLRKLPMVVRRVIV